MDIKLTWMLIALSACELLLFSFICTVQYLDLILEVLYIDHLLQSLLNLFFASLFSLSFSHVIFLTRTGFLICFCMVLYWYQGDTMPSARSDKMWRSLHCSINKHQECPMPCGTSTKVPCSWCPRHLLWVSSCGECWGLGKACTLTAMQCAQDCPATGTTCNGHTCVSVCLKNTLPVLVRQYFSGRNKICLWGKGCQKDTYRLYSNDG